MANPTKLRVMQTVITSWRLLIRHWRLTVLLGLPLVTFLLLALPLWNWLAAPLLSKSGVMAWIPDPALAASVWGLLMQLPVYLGFAAALVPLHRRILLGESVRFPFGLGRRQLAYGGFLLLLETAPFIFWGLASAMLSLIHGTKGLGGGGILPDIVVEIASASVLFGASILIVVLSLYLYARLCLALPGLAIGASGAISGAWRNSRGKEWSLLIITLIVSLPVVLPIIGIEAAFWGGADAAHEGPILLNRETVRDNAWPAIYEFSVKMAVWSVLGALFALLDGTALSLCYRQLVQADEMSPAPAREI